MGSHVVGFCASNETFQKMVSVHNACKEANVDLPEDVLDFFGIDISKLPKGVKYISFDIYY